MSDFIPIGKAASKVVDLASRRRREVGMDSPVVGQLKASISKLDREQELRDWKAEQGRGAIESGLRQLRANAGDDLAIAYLKERLLSIGGGT